MEEEPVAAGDNVIMNGEMNEEEMNESQGDSPDNTNHQ